MKKIYLISNSQGTSNGVNEEESYPSLLQKALPDYEWHFLIISGGSVKEFNSYLENIVLVKPDFAIFQIGIIDCVRRILSEKEKKMLKALPLGWMISKTLHDHRKTTIRWRHRFKMNCRKVNPKIFSQELLNMVQKLTGHGIKCLFLEIPKFDSRYEQKFYPLINDDVDRYNEIIRRFNSSPLFSLKDDLYSIWQQGTVHFNQEGHRRVAERIKEIILT